MERVNIIDKFAHDSFLTKSMCSFTTTTTPKRLKTQATELVVDCGIGPICDFLFHVTSPMYYEREFYTYFQLYLS